MGSINPAGVFHLSFYSVILGPAFSMLILLYLVLYYHDKKLEKERR